MEIQLNLLEIASEMAHRELLLQACINHAVSEDEAEGMITEITHDEVRYKEEYQVEFNSLYDMYYDSVLALGKPVDTNVLIWTTEEVLERIDCSEEEAILVIERLNKNEYVGEAINDMIKIIGQELNLKIKEE